MLTMRAACWMLVSAMVASMLPGSLALIRSRSLDSSLDASDNILWVPVDSTHYNCRRTCKDAGLVSVMGGNTLAGKKTEPAPAALCANVGYIVNPGAIGAPEPVDQPGNRFLDEGTTKPGSAGDLCYSYLQGTAIDLYNFLCGCVPSKLQQEPAFWVNAADPEGCPDTHYMAPFICRYATYTDVYLGHVNSVRCGFPSRDPIEDCPYEVTPAANTTQPAANWGAAAQEIFQMPKVDIRPSGPQCLFRTTDSQALQLTVYKQAYDRLCMLKSFSYMIYVPPVQDPTTKRDEKKTDTFEK